MARARSFGNIRKLPSGRYQARYWRLGKQVAADTTFASKTDARRWLATVEADMIRGVRVDPDAGRIPFGKYAARWVAERPVRPRTREIYEGQLRHIVPVFANVHLCDVHPVDVRTWHGRLAASGLHHNTVAKIYRLFRSIMTTAVDVGLIARNPVRIKSRHRWSLAPRSEADHGPRIERSQPPLPHELLSDPPVELGTTGAKLVAQARADEA